MAQKATTFGLLSARLTESLFNLTGHHASATDTTLGFLLAGCSHTLFAAGCTGVNDRRT